MAEIEIIGGSAAGLFAGYLLARAGKEVRLFDANDVLNVESRTLITTSRLREVLGFFPQNAVVNQIDQIDLYSPKRMVSIPMQEPDLVVERATINRLLAKMAIDAGVEIRGGCKLIQLSSDRRAIRFTIRDSHRDRIEEFTTRVVIGADGISSRTAKSTGASVHPTTPILQAIVELPNGERAGTTKVWFEPEDTSYFYWSIPQSRQHTAVGFIANDGKSARARLERFLGRMGLKVLELQSARIPAYRHFTRPWRRLADCSVYLIGDAAAHVKVTTVGGLVTGLRGARAAAEAILHRRHYLKEIRPLRRELSLHLLIRSTLNRFRGDDYDHLLGLLNEKTIQLLGRHSRDEAAGMLWRVLLAQPRFLTFLPYVSGRFWKSAWDGRFQRQEDNIGQSFAS